MVRHAIAAEDKRVRRQAILDAARTVFDEGDGSLPAVAQVAAAAGLAKGTTYLYFRTKEEIFAALLLEGWGAVLEEIQTTFQTTTGRRAQKIDAFLTTFVRALDRHPDLLRLDALGYGVLEKNMDLAKLREFKLAFVGQLARVGAVIDESLRLTPGRGISLLMRSYALTRGLWQTARPFEDPPSKDGEPAFAVLYPDFRTELLEALREYWRGALAPPWHDRPQG